MDSIGFKIQVKLKKSFKFFVEKMKNRKKLISFLYPYLFTFLLLQPSFLKLSYSFPILISVSVGMVGNKIITSREVHAHYIIEGVLFKKTKKIPKEIKLQDQGFLLQVDSLILEEALYFESKNFFKPKISESEISQNLKKLKEQAQDSEYWEKWNISDSELKRILKRKLSVKKFMKFRIDSSMTLITDEAAERYYNQNKVKFGRTSFKKIKNNIKHYLSQKLLNERLQEWFRILQKKYNAQNFLYEI